MNQRFWYAVPGLCIMVAIAAGLLLHSHEAKAPTLWANLPGQADSPTRASSTPHTSVPTSPISNTPSRTDRRPALNTSPTPNTPLPIATSSEAAAAPQGPSIVLSIQGLYSNKQVAITTNESLLTLLQTLNAQDPQMQLKTQNYSGLGALITSMGGLTNGTDKQYWQYKINGVEPQIGASGYILKPGDRVDWFFGPSQQ